MCSHPVTSSCLVRLYGHADHVQFASYSNLETKVEKLASDVAVLKVQDYGLLARAVTGSDQRPRPLSPRKMPVLTPEPDLHPDTFDIDFDETRPIKRPAATRRAGISSIARLTDQKSTSDDLVRFKSKVRALPTFTTQQLVLRIATTADPLILWAIHVHLDTRNIPPAQRWPANTNTPQAEFITWLADLLWFAKRNPDHQPKFKGWCRLFKDKTNSPEWRERAFWLYDNTARRSIAHITSKGLALSGTQRQDLMTLPTSEMVKQRRELHPDRVEAVRRCLLTHALAHPDRSSKLTPETIANRRAAIWRAHILTGRSPTATAQTWQVLTGTPTTRQIISKQVAITDEVLRLASKLGDLEHHAVTVYLR